MKFIHHNQPYGTVYLKDCEIITEVADENSPSYIKHRAANGMVRVSGVVESGTEASRLFQFRSTRDLTGQKWTVSCVSPDDLARGYKTTIAM